MPLTKPIHNSNSLHRHCLPAPAKMWVNGLLTALLLGAAGLACARDDNTEDCVFAGPVLPDVLTVNDADIVFSHWNETRLERRVITRDGDLLAIKYWGCQHQGVQAVMLIPPHTIRAGKIPAKLRKLAQIAVAPGDYPDFLHALQAALQATPLNPESAPQTLQLSLDGNTAAQVHYQIAGDSILLEIHLIRN
jgi:hypothetical protein